MIATKILIIGFLSIVLTSCANLQLSSSGAGLNLKTKPDTTWKIYDVRTKTSNDTLYLSGKLMPLTWAGSPQGHIDISGFSDSGDLLFERVRPWRRSSIIRHGRVRYFGSYKFYDDIPILLPETYQIFIAFHGGSRFVTNQLNHTNMAGRKFIEKNQQ